MAATTRPTGRTLALLVVSILCSLASLAALVFSPEGTASWRTSLNVIALLLVITATTMLSRRSG
jgi:hypothetical protein